MWNWGDNVAFVHDEIATDKRNPRVNANGPLYGVDIGNDFLLVTDTLEHSSKMIKIPLRENDPPVPSMFQTEGFKPWRDFGAEAVWNDPANPHNPMIDAEGRVWLTTRVRHPNNPDWCREGSDNAYAQVLPHRPRRPPHRLLRSGDRRLRPDRHLLRHAPPAVRRGRQRHAVLQRRRPRHRLARHEALRRNRRRTARPALVPDRHRHQWRRRHHEAVERAGPARQPRGAAVRPGARHPRAGRRLRRHRQPARRRGLDRLGRLPRPHAAHGARRQPAGDLHQRALHRAGGEGLPHPRPRRRPQRRPLDGAGRQQPLRLVRPRRCAPSSAAPRRATAGSATKAGPSTRRPARTSGTPTSGPTSTITTGSTSSTRSASARTSRSPTGRARTRCWPSIPRPASGPSFASRTRRASTAAGSTAASTIQTPAGRAAASTPPTAPTRRGTSRAARWSRGTW